MKSKITRGFFFLLLSVNLALAQDGTVDLTFNTPVHPTGTEYNGFIGDIYATKILSSGKILVYGDLTEYMGIPVRNLVRLNPNGSVDPTFNVGSGPSDISYTYIPNSNLIAEQSDGKILLGGGFSTYNGSSRNRIVRLNVDGSIDNTFNIGTGFNSLVYAVKLQSDGKILCGGYFTSYNGTTINHVARLNTNGTLDATFNPGAGAANAASSGEGVYAIETQPDGKILIGGRFNGFNGVTKNGLIRLEANGAVDNTFQIGSGTDIYDRVLKILYNSQTNKIFVGGKLRAFNGTATKNIISLNTDGSVNNGFMPGSDTGTTFFMGIHDFVMLSNGKVLVCGNFNVGTNADLFLYNADGTDDTNFKFENNQALNTPEIYTLSVDSNDGIYAAGYFQNVNSIDNSKGSIVKIFADGSTDIAFNPNLGSWNYGGGWITAMRLRNGKILINAGVMYNEKLCKTISINTDGSIYEPDFNNFKNLDLDNNQSILSNDNKIFVSSAFVYKISENGMIDNTFSNTSNLYTPPFFNIDINDLVQQPDNKLLIAGSFRLTNNYYPNIARLNTDGTVDASFAVGNGFTNFDSKVSGIALQPDGKVVAVGEFTQYKTTLNLNNIARINPDGSFDNTFSFGTGFNHWVRKVVITSGNKLLICGRFTQYNGWTSPYIIRLNPDGTVDTTFNSPFSEGDLNSDSDNMLIQPNGKILMTILYNGVQKLYRLNTDGSIDNSFHDINFGVITNLTCSNSSYDKVSSIILLPNKILITGCFDYLDGYRRVSIAMLNNSESTLDIPENVKIQIVSIYPNPVNDCFKINNPNFIRAELYTVDGKKVFDAEILDNNFCIGQLKPAIYIAKLFDNQGNVAQVKLVKK